MFDFQATDPKAPSCPLCTSEMVLKTIFRQLPEDHFVFKCAPCDLEYPVLGRKRP